MVIYIREQRGKNGFNEDQLIIEYCSMLISLCHETNYAEELLILCKLLLHIIIMRLFLNIVIFSVKVGDFRQFATIRSTCTHEK